MAAYCFKNGSIQKAQCSGDSQNLTVIFHLSAEGAMVESRQLPELSEGEGCLAYRGTFYVEPLEVQIEFLKAANGKQWLEALLLRHVERVRQVSEDLFVMAEIKEVEP